VLETLPEVADLVRKLRVTLLLNLLIVLINRPSGVLVRFRLLKPFDCVLPKGLGGEYQAIDSVSAVLDNDPLFIDRVEYNLKFGPARVDVLLRGGYVRRLSDETIPICVHIA